MSVDTWEEFCQYTWRSGETELYTELEGDTLYYFLTDTPEVRHKWFRIDGISVKTLSRLWTIVGYSPRKGLCGPFLSEVPPVIAKIRLMEQRHQRYMERKHHA